MSRSGSLPASWMRAISERSVPERWPQGNSTYSRKSPARSFSSNSSSERNQYSRPSSSPSRRSRVVAEMASASSGIWTSRAFSRVPFPAPEVPVTTKTGELPVEEPNQLGPLAVGEAHDRLRLADEGLVQKTRGLHPTELGDGHQHVEHLCGRDVLRRVVEDLVDLRAAHFQVLLQLGSLHPDVVRALQGFHSLVARPGRRLRLSLRCRHGG